MEGKPLETGPSACYFHFHCLISTCFDDNWNSRQSLFKGPDYPVTFGVCSHQNNQQTLSCIVNHDIEYSSLRTPITAISQNIAQQEIRWQNNRSRNSAHCTTCHPPPPSSSPRRPHPRLDPSEIVTFTTLTIVNRSKCRSLLPQLSQKYSVKPKCICCLSWSVFSWR